VADDRSPLVVLDASVLVNSLTAPGELGKRADHAIRGHRLAAPEQMVAETFHSIRGRVLGGKLPAAAGRHAVEYLSRVPLELVPTRLLLERMWELRDNVSGYDAAYIAAAEHLGVALVTFDKRLAAAPGLRCEVRVP
jgi:predicted nucleic acid-binding protein